MNANIIFKNEILRLKNNLGYFIPRPSVAPVPPALGEGVKMAVALLIQIPKGLERSGKNVRFLSVNAFKSTSVIFHSGQYWGHQRSSKVKYIEIRISTEVCHYLRNCQRLEAAEEAPDNSWTTLSLGLHFRQHCSKFKILGRWAQER